MLRPRLIPCLLLHDGGLVKTMRFSSPKYVGDPLNAVRIFNEKQVDELFVADIDASARMLEPNYTIIGKLAAECRMPLCYAGGVKSEEQIERLIALGVEKVALGTAAIKSHKLIESAAKRVGSQSIVVVLDAKRTGMGDAYTLVSHGGRVNTGVEPAEFAKLAESMGAGEILLNSVDLDGMMSGYDMALVRRVRSATRLPLTVLGGAGSLSDVQKLVHEFGTIGAAAGSLFVFKGRFKAVLIQYPAAEIKDALFQ